MSYKQVVCASMKTKFFQDANKQAGSAENVLDCSVFCSSHEHLFLFHVFTPLTSLCQLAVRTSTSTRNIIVAQHVHSGVAPCDDSCLPLW